MFPDVIGEINAAGCSLSEEASFIRPVKAAAMCVLLGRMAGYRLLDLGNLGLSALLMDVGSIVMLPRLLDKPEPLSGTESREIRKHPDYGSALLSQYSVTAVGHHGVILPPLGVTVVLRPRLRGECPCLRSEYTTGGHPGQALCAPCCTSASLSPGSQLPAIYFALVEAV